MAGQVRDSSQRRALGYVRVSELGGRSGPELHTIDVQRAAIERAALGAGLDLVDVLVEVNRSGADADRPLFREAMRRVEEGDVSCLLVWKVSRFSRDLAQAVLDARAIKRAGGNLIAADEPFDTASAHGQLMLHMLMAMAEYEREVLKEQWGAIKRRVLERGSHLGRTPIGYLRYAVEPTKPWHVDREAAARILSEYGWEAEPVPGQLIPDPVGAPLVRECFERRARHATYADLARLLDERSGREGSHLHSSTQMRRLLALRVYLGEARQGDLVNPAAHPRIVSRSLWTEVQQVEKGWVRRARRAARQFHLSGLVYCAGCSYRMGGGTIRQPRKVWAATGEPIAPGTRTDLLDAGEVVTRDVDVRVYRCAGRRGTGRCPAPSVILAETLERLVLDWSKAALAARVIVETDESDDELLELEERLAEADRALLELASVDMRRELGPDWMPMMRRLRAEKEALASARDALVASVQGQTLKVELADLDEDELLQLVREGIRAVFVRRMPRGASAESRLRVVWKGERVPPLGGPRNRIPPTPFDGFDDDARARVA